MAVDSPRVSAGTLGVTAGAAEMVADRHPALADALEIGARLGSARAMK